MRADVRGHPERANGFTLIELLTVVTLIAFVASVVLPGAMSNGEDVSLRVAARQWRQLDRMARLSGRSGRPMTLQLDANRHGLHAIDQSSGETVLKVNFEKKVRGWIETAGDEEAIVINGSGRSIDYSLVLRVGKRVEIWRINGSSGHAIRDGSERTP